MFVVPSVDAAVTSFRLRRHKLHRHMQVFSHTMPVERLALFQSTRRLPFNARALEIGSHLGSSALFICAGLKEVSGHLTCVDTWMNQTMPDGEKNTYEEFKANTRQYLDMITPLRKFSYELTFSDLGGPLDFVFIDGDHSECGVRSDFRVIEPWVKRGGIVAFHDVTPAFPGVHVVLGESLASGRWQLCRLVGSLGIICKVSD